MSTVLLDHFNLSVKAADDANEYVRFFTEALGLHVGPRPPFNFDGHWLYAGDATLVHISIIPPSPGDRRDHDLAGVSGNTGVIDHVAFWTDNHEEISARLKRGGWPYRERMLPGRRMYQIFVSLPAGLVVEVSAPTESVE